MCDFLGLEHQGGSGRPDCISNDDPDLIVEVKDYNRKFNAHDYKIIKEKPWTEGKKLNIVVKNGCSINAIKEAAKDPNTLLICDFGENLKDNEKRK